MGDIYDAYGTIMSSRASAHQGEIERTAAQFRNILLPVIEQYGVRLERASVLEFGAGWGKNLLALRALGGKLLRGVDISGEQVALGKRLGLAGLQTIKQG